MNSDDSTRRRAKHSCPPLVNIEKKNPSQSQCARASWGLMPLWRGIYDRKSAAVLANRMGFLLDKEGLSLESI